MMRKMPSKITQGQAGVYTVAAQLLLHGINPSFPAVDRGADIITDWGTRIQVKCSYRRKSIWGGTYHFCLGMPPYVNTGIQRKRSDSRIFSEECDFFVFWGIDDNRFWIVPSAMTDGRTSVVMVGKDTPWLRLDQASILADSESGMSQRAMAEKYGICQKTVLRVIHRKIIRTDIDTEFNKALLRHENRWDLLLSAEELLSQGEAKLEVSAYAEEV